MGIVQTEWDRERCRAENGIFFGDDTMILLVGSPEKGGYRPSTREPVERGIKSQPDYWTDLTLMTNCSVQSDRWRVEAGDSCSEGSGFVAVVDAKSGCLLWILQLDNSECFDAIQIIDDKILASSKEYPFWNRWMIPIETPEQLVVVCEHAP